jgi:plasmid stabilization system protein ParE
LRPVRFLESASSDIERAKAWYRDITPELASRFQAAIEQATSRIADQPEAMQIIDVQVRRWPVDGFPHGILYRIDTDSIVVLAVFHPKQAPGKWRERTIKEHD